MSKTQLFTPEELHAPYSPLIYEGDELREIAFPLGGLGTGCVSLSGRGALVDWEVFNRPKGSFLPYTFVTLWAKAQGAQPITRVVQAPPLSPFSGQGCRRSGGLGFGVGRGDGSGSPPRARRAVAGIAALSSSTASPRRPSSRSECTGHGRRSVRSWPTRSARCRRASEALDR